MSSPNAAGATHGARRADNRLTLRHNPVGLLFSASLWRSAGFLFGYVLTSGVVFAIVAASVLVSLGLSITIVAVPLLIGAAAVVRGCAELERARLRQVFAEPVRGYYRPPEAHGLWRQARARWAQGTTWRDLSYLFGLWPFLFTLDAAAFATWLCLLAGVALPLWYAWAPAMCAGVCGSEPAHGLLIGYYPNGLHGPGHHGLLVSTLPAALVAAAGFAVALLLFNYAVVAVARLHAQVARALLRRPADPLTPARAVLAGPGALGPLS